MSNSHLKVDRDGLEFIAHWEGLRLKPYYCSANKLTVGYGHVITPQEASKYPVGKAITREEALLLFQGDLQFRADAVAKMPTDLNQNQFNALVAFAFNVGTKWVAQGSVFEAVRDKRFADVPAALDKFNKVTKGGVKVVEPGLAARRTAEGKLFLAQPPENGRSVLISMKRIKA